MLHTCLLTATKIMRRQHMSWYTEDVTNKRPSLSSTDAMQSDRAGRASSSTILGVRVRVRVRARIKRGADRQSGQVQHQQHHVEGGCYINV